MRHGLRPGRGAAAEQRPLPDLHQQHHGAGEGRARAPPRPLGRGRWAGAVVAVLREAVTGAAVPREASRLLPPPPPPPCFAPACLSSAARLRFILPKRRVARRSRAWPPLCVPLTASGRPLGSAALCPPRLRLWQRSPLPSFLTTSESRCVSTDRLSCLAVH